MAQSYYTIIIYVLDVFIGAISMSVRLYALTVLLLVASTNLVAAEWYIVDHSGDTTFFIDKSSIRRDANTSSFWASYVYQYRKNGIDQVKTHFVVNCKSMAMGQDKWITYDNNENIIDSSVIELRLEPITPESIAEEMARAACTGKFKGKQLKKLDVNLTRHVIGQMTSSQ